MVNVQSEFNTFHDEIKLSEENQELRDKRDILLNKLRKNISDEAASFTTFNQGSYAMGRESSQMMEILILMWV